MDARGPKYTVNGIGFNSKKAVQDHCRAIIQKAVGNLKPQWGARLPILDDADEAFLLDFIRYLPSYEAYRGAQNVLVGYVGDQQKAPHWGLYAILPDASEWCFGFSKFGMTPAEAEIVNLKSAKRNAVLDQTQGYKEQYFDGHEEALCEATGELMVRAAGFRNSCHVDHESPTFDQLDKEFFGDWEPPLVNDGEMWQLSDEWDDFKKTWQEFHRKHAKLRCVTRAFNLSRKDVRHESP